MKQNLTIRLFVFFSFLLPGNDIFPVTAEEIELDVRSLSMGGLHALSHELINPAHLPFQPSIKLGVAVHNRFQIKELNVFQLVGLFPNRWLDAGIKFSTFGFSDYRYSLFSTTLAKKINHRFSIGSGLYVGHETGDDYVKAMVHLKADIGVYFRASEWINLALLLRNVATNNRLDQFLFNLGIEWHPITSFGLVMEAISNWGDFYAMSFGLEYEIMDQLFVRAGVRTNPNMPAMGVSYSFEKITVDVSYFSHSILGNSTSIGISFHF